MREDPLIAEIDAILPQTQCRRCGFPGCQPYAAAIAEGRAAINQCPPGGPEGIRKLAALLGVAPMPLNTAHGFHTPKAAAFIDEQACIGCTLCILACPVDAIVGAAKQTHTVLVAECTGCELCIAPCPVDCISMVPLEEEDQPRRMSEEEKKNAADRARARYQFRLQRLERESQEQELKRLTRKDTGVSVATMTNDERRKAAVQAALARARAGRARKDDNAGFRGLPLPGDS